jgi:hypothetical protein
MMPELILPEPQLVALVVVCHEHDAEAIVAKVRLITGVIAVKPAPPEIPTTIL